MKQRGGGSDFCTVRSPYDTQEKRKVKVLREKEQEAPGQWSPGTSGVQGVFKRERTFVRETSSERELDVQGLRVRSPLVKFSFS